MGTQIVFGPLSLHWSSLGLRSVPGKSRTFQEKGAKSSKVEGLKCLPQVVQLSARVILLSIQTQPCLLTMTQAAGAAWQIAQIGRIKQAPATLAEAFLWVCSQVPAGLNQVH